MTGEPTGAGADQGATPAGGAQQPIPYKPWGLKTKGALPKYVRTSLEQVYDLLDKKSRQRLGLMIKVPVFIKDPLLAQDKPFLGVQQIEVRLEPGFGHGPTSARVTVVDPCEDPGQVDEPITWDPACGWFKAPNGDWLPVAPKEPPEDKELSPKQVAAYTAAYSAFIENAINNPHFQRLNVWAVVQRVLEFYEHPQALGRAVPWGFEGNRLIVIPHAGYKPNACYDRKSKSLRFYYFGDKDKPVYTCLSHDIIAHETGHAVLDGIRPYYNQVCSLQTAAFHEFIGDLTALLLALFNRDIRHEFQGMARGDMSGAGIVAGLARQFDKVVERREYLRSAINDLTMEKVADSFTPHTISQVLTGAMFDILVGIARRHMEKNIPEPGPAEASGEPAGEASEAGAEDADGEVGGAVVIVEPAVQPVQAGAPAATAAPPPAAPPPVTPAQALWWAAERFRRVALQPLDLCPPCDIQFLDYARAIIRNDILTNPVDMMGYRQIMLAVFHRRGLCTCGYQADQPLPPGCAFQEVTDGSLDELERRLVRPDIERVARSRTAAYYFLSVNRKQLRIPAQQDIVVVDLYDNDKMGVAAERLPREIVLEYLWVEEVSLQDERVVRRFGELEGETAALPCGGTLVFDDRGNLLSWFHKPGTEHLTFDEAQALRQKAKPTQQDRAELADLEEGERRRDALLEYTAGAVRRRLISDAQGDNSLADETRPISAVRENGLLHFEIEPHLRRSDFDMADAT